MVSSAPLSQAGEPMSHILRRASPVPPGRTSLPARPIRNGTGPADGIAMGLRHAWWMPGAGGTAQAPRRAPGVASPGAGGSQSAGQGEAQ